jgi:hypothetical protein
VLNDLILHVFVVARGVVSLASRRLLGDERGEGVISAAIAVLIMAFLGAAMWIVFRQILDDSGSKTQSTINEIGGE